MIIDVNKLKYQGKTEENFSFGFVPQRELVGLPGARIENEVRVDVTVRFDGKDVIATGTVTYVIAGECSRCLAPATATVSDVLFAEYSQTDSEKYPIKSGLIDLTEPVEEAVIMSSPLVIYCREDCKGLCPDCGANLNDHECDCKRKNF